MKTIWIMAGLMGALAVVGCNSAKSPDAVANTVAADQQTAANKTVEAQKDAMQNVEKAQVKADDKTIEMSNAEAKGAYDVAMTKADGTHQISLDKCKALAGDAQANCKNRADADYEAAKATAKASEVARTQ